MADRYWVGGTGTWSTSTTNWSTSSGGGGGASAPTSADNVIFDQNSNSGTNAFTVTLGGISALNCLSLTVQNLDGAMTLAGTIALNIYGSLTFPASNFNITASSTFSFLSTTAQTITTSGITMPNTIFNGGSTGSWVLQDNYTTLNSVNLYGGTIDLNGKTLTTTTIATSGTTTKYFKSSTNTSIILTGSDGAFFIGLSGTNLTVDNTVTFNIASTYLTTTGSINNTTTAPITVTFTNTGVNYIASLGTGSLFKRLDFTNYWNTSLSMGTVTVTITEALIIPSTLSISGTAGTNHFVFAPPSTTTATLTNNGTAINYGVSVNGAGGTLQLNEAFTQGSTQLLTLTNGTLNVNSQTVSAGVFTVVTGTHAITNGTVTAASVTHTSGDLSIGTGYNVVCTGAYTFTAGSITINNGVNLSIGSMSSANTGTRSIAFGTGSITTTGTGTVWNVTGTTGLSFTGTSNITISNNTATAVTITNTATAASAMNFNIVNGTYALTLTSGNSYRNLNFTGFGGTWSPAATTHTMYGNLTISATTQTISPATAVTDTITFASTSGTNIITTNNWVINCGIAINGAGGTVQFADLFGQSPSYSLKLTNGTLDINSQTTSAGIFTILSGTHAIANGTLNCASVTHTSGDLTVSTTATVICTGTYTYTTGTINIGNGATLSVGQFSSSNSNARSIAFNTSGILALTGSGTVWNTGTVTNFSYTGTSNVRLTNSGSTATTITPGPMTAAQALNFYITAGTYSLTITSLSNVNTLDFTGFSGTYAQAATAISVYNNLVFSGTMSTTTTTGAISMIATSGTKTIQSNGATLTTNITLNGVGGTFQLADAFTQTSTAILRLTNGTFDMAGYTTTVGVFTIVNGTHAIANGTLNPRTITHTSGDLSIGTGYNIGGINIYYTFTSGSITINDGVTLAIASFTSANTNTRSIAFGTGKIQVGTGLIGTAWNVTGVTGLTYTGTPTVDVIVINPIVTNTATAATAFNFNFISQSAGVGTVTLTTGNSYNNLNFTNCSSTVSLTNTTHTIYGNLTLGSSTVTSATAGTNTFAWVSTSGTRTITSNGATANFGISLNGVGQTVQLADAFVQGSTQRLTIANGTFDMAGYSTSAGVLTINTGTHAIANGTLNCASVTHTSGDLSMGTGYTVVCSGTYTFTAGSITINDGVNLSVGSMSSANTGTRSIAFGTGSITTTGTGTVWNVTGVTGMTYTGTPTVNISNNTATAITVTNTATILSAFDFKFINGTYTLTLTNGNTYRSLNFTGFAGTVAFGATTHSLYGDLTLGPNTTTSGTVGSTHVSFIAGLLTKTITTNGRTVNFTININGASTTVYLGDAFVQGSSYSLILTVGTFDMANYSTSVGIFNISNGTHAIANGTLNCASVTHTAADLTVSTTATVVATGTYTFTSGTINIGNGATLTTGTFSSANSNARSIAFNTSGILALTSSGTVWNTSTVTNFSYTGTSNIRLTYAGALSVTINTGAMSVAQSLNFYVTAGTYNLTTTNGGVFNTLDFTGFGGTYAQAATNTTVYGNLSFSNLMTSTSTTGTMTIAGTANTFIYGNGHTVGCNIKISKTSGTAQTVLGNAFSSSYTNGLILEGGIFDTAGYNFTVVSFDAGNTSLSRSIKLNSSNVTITGIQWLVAASNLTVDAGTSTISMTSASSKAFYGGGFTWYNLNQGGAGSLSMGDSNTFNDITNTVQPATVYFQTSNTTVSNFSLSGTAGNPITITSTTGSHTLTKTSGEVFVSYCIISNSNATGGALWRAPTNYGNTNGGSNTGWNFSPTSTTAVLSNMIAFF